MIYEKSFSTFIDVIKGISIGCFVASMVGFVLQKNENSWLLVVYGFIYLLMAIVWSIIFDRLKEKSNE